MKIALAQTNIIWENKNQNILKAESIVQRCAKDNVDIVLFPEMSFTGFSMNTDVTSENDNYTIKKLSQFASENNIYMGFGWVKKCSEKCRNIYTIVDKKGSIISSYSKIHPFTYSGEDEYFSGGNDIISFSIDGVYFSIFICYDLRFPELFRAVADDVHAIIVPACWPAKRAEHWKTLLRARAIENQVYIFAINCQGNVGELYYSGDSCVINPNGDIMKMLSNEEGVITFVFEDDVNTYRDYFPVLKDKIINYSIFDNMIT